MKKYKFFIWFVYFVLLAFAFCLHDYFMRHELLNGTNVLIIEFLFLFLGWLGAVLEAKLRKHKKKK